MIHVDSQTDRDSLSAASIQSARRFAPVLLHAGSIWRKYVLDVDGVVVRCPLGLPVNVYRADFEDILQQGDIRFVYDVARELRFVTSSQEQYNRFKADLVHNATSQAATYHVYFDDDVAPLRLLRSRAIGHDARLPR